MTVSLDEFLSAGQLRPLRRGMPRAEVQVILGPPDAAGGMSRKYPEPSVFLYGTVELWFGQQRPHDLTGIFWEAGEKGAFRLTASCVIADWAFTPEWTFAQVEEYLRERDLPFDYRDSPSPDDPMPWLSLPCGVTIAFQGDRLHTLSM